MVYKGIHYFVSS